ncbi:MAG: rRNA maturation RNase YbeY [Deltaproteobacteria bacterium]|jgi:probable rRNA maturation factor|nr:rRNA maturation RNase YbeY [Deltaproteobacteria bacterium]
MTVFINDQTPQGWFSHHKLRRRLGRLLRELGRSNESLTVLVTDDHGIREINKEFRRRDESTNVLAFPDTDEAMGLKRYLGDIAVSADTVKREAEIQGLSVGEHFYFCVIHALLHLLGYDHERSLAEERRQNDETFRLMSFVKHDL